VRGLPFGLSHSMKEFAINNAFKSFATLSRTPSTPRLVAHDEAIVPQTVLGTGRRLTPAMERTARHRRWAFCSVPFSLCSPAAVAHRERKAAATR
jgi:hypothetical protein